MGKEEGNLINITVQGRDCYCPSCLRDIDFRTVRVTRLVIEFECPGCAEGCFVQTDEFVFYAEKH